MDQRIKLSDMMYDNNDELPVHDGNIRTGSSLTLRDCVITRTMWRIPFDP